MSHTDLKECIYCRNLHSGNSNVCEFCLRKPKSEEEQLELESKAKYFNIQNEPYKP